MIQHIKDRLHREDEGFTLIELMVVVLIIAILIAIAIPTFLGARGRAQDRAAQSAARNVTTNAKAIFTDNENYFDATVTELLAAEPTITSVAGSQASSGPDEVSVVAGAAVGPSTKSKVFYAAALSDSGRCFYLRSLEVALAPDAGLRWLRGAVAANCTADAAAAFGNWASGTRSPSSSTPLGA
jgi:type IV pilus assembly protein PilA